MFKSGKKIVRIIGHFKCGIGFIVYQYADHTVDIIHV